MTIETDAIVPEVFSEESIHLDAKSEWQSHKGIVRLLLDLIEDIEFRYFLPHFSIVCLRIEE